MTIRGRKTNYERGFKLGSSWRNLIKLEKNPLTKMDLSYSKKATRKRIKSKISKSKKGKSDFIKGFREGYGE